MLKKDLKGIKGIAFLVWIKLRIQRVRIPGYSNLNLYDLGEIYLMGLVKGALKARAGSVAFSFFMAIFPFLLFMLNLIPFIPVDNLSDTFSVFIESMMPDSSKDFFMSIYSDIQHNQRGGLLSSSFLLSIFLMGNGINSLFNAFQGSHHIEVSRSFLKQYLYSVFIGIFISFLLISAVMLYVFFEITIIKNLSDEGLINEHSNWPMVAEYILLLVMSVIIPAVLFYFGTPGGRNEKFFSPAIYITSAMFVISTLLFGIYVNTFSSYNELYGSIGALLVLMLYIWLNSVILLLGFELRSILNGLKKK